MVKHWLCPFRSSYPDHKEDAEVGAEPMEQEEEEVEEEVLKEENFQLMLPSGEPPNAQFCKVTGVSKTEVNNSRVYTSWNTPTLETVWRFVRSPVLHHRAPD